jgi:glyoxylase-like metal-dependent hydrolase (beta-lactamase superfamily II)
VDQPELSVVAIPSMPFDENSYVAWLDGREDCVVFDPGLEPDRILDELDRRRLTPAAILLTHGHADHIAGNAALRHRWPRLSIAVGRLDADALADPWKNLSASFGFEVTSPQADVLLDEGDVWQGAGLRLDVRHVPGHSPGHVVYVWRERAPFRVLGGDVLFAGSIGRTDLPGGSFQRLAAGIHDKLFTLPDDSIVLPGHGQPTTIGREKRTNPFVGEPAGYRSARRET